MVTLWGDFFERGRFFQNNKKNDGFYSRWELVRKLVYNRDYSQQFWSLEP